MTSLITQPPLMVTAAADLAKINSALDSARAAAAGPTTSVVAAAQDEISAATATLFGGYAHDYQALLKHAAGFHNQFAAALSSAGSAYAAAEATNASAISGAVERLTSPIQQLLGISSPAPAAHPLTAVQPTLNTPNLAWAMGGSGQPIPSQSYVDEVLNYIDQMITPSSSQALFTPEGLYPLTAIKDLTLAVSVERGVEILDDTIQQQLLGNPSGSTSILGYSQSAIIASIEMKDLMSSSYTGTVPSANQLGFTLIGDPMNPNGGLLERFTPLTLPSLGVDFYGATPSNTPYPTNIYSLQYDGYADFPRYPINLLSDLNAFYGLETVHGTYPDINPSNLPSGDTLVPLTTSTGYTGATNYYMITNSNLPILNPLKDIPVIGTPLYDLLKPDTTMLVNLGYGDPNYGYSTAPADVATPLGLFPHYNQLTLAQDLATGAQQGFTAFSADIKAELPVAASSLSLANIGHALAGGTGGFSLPAGLASALASPDSFIQALETANTNITNTITNVAATSYAVLLPTADIANALVTSLPGFDVNLVLSGVEQMINGDPLGGLQYALVAPLAASTGLVVLAGGFELSVVLTAASEVVSDITDLV